MSRDAKNSIGLWIGTLVFVGLFWAALHFDVGVGIPDRWLHPLLGVVIALNALQTVWRFFRSRNGKGR